MSNENHFVQQTLAKIAEWNHEIIELEARIRHAVDSPDQLRICKQRLLQLKSQRDAAENRIQEVQNA